MNRNFFFSSLLLVLASLLCGCEDAPEAGEPCDDAGEYGCDGREVLQCRNLSSTDTEWVLVAECNSSQTCQVSGEGYECRN
jgi:hypothetical protein